MSLKVSLRLKFTNIKKVIRIKYNTFEKATFDEYLVCSAILHAKSEDEFNVYVEQLTGSGSLNAHFKKLYQQYKDLSKEDLQKIMDNSMIPTLKIDESGWYVYYPELNVSVFKNKVFWGDMENIIDARSMLHIQEEIVEQTVYTKFEQERTEPYTITFDDDNKMTFRFFDKDLSLSEELFTHAVQFSLSGIGSYGGTIHDTCVGSGWSLVTDALLNSLKNNSNFYYKDGDHCLIRNDGVKVTHISKINGLYIYRETVLPYKNNPDLCEEVLVNLVQNLAIHSLKTSAMDVILQNIRNKTISQLAINAALRSKEDQIWALRGLELLMSGVVDKWLVASKKAFLKYAEKRHLNALYQVAPELDYKIEQLLQIDQTLLSPVHKEAVDRYLNNLTQMRNTIKLIIGDVTTSGLRERVKVLKSDDDTKKFSKLCNRLIGHVKQDLDSASLAEVDQWHAEALELKTLSEIIEKKLVQIDGK